MELGLRRSKDRAQGPAFARDKRSFQLDSYRGYCRRRRVQFRQCRGPVRWKKEDPCGDIPVIAVTAYGRPEDRARAPAAGFRLHLTKPVTPDMLAAAILRVLHDGGRSSRRIVQK